MHTSTITDGEPTFVDPKQIIEALEKFIRGPQLIGNLHGYPVYVDDSLPPATIEVRTQAGIMRFSIDHPYIQGTALEAEARALLQEKPRSR